MTTIELPALRSNDPLGFLAALGVVELCTAGLEIDARLGWSGFGGHAWLDSDATDIVDLAERLATVARAWAASGRLVPPSSPAFIVAPKSTAERKERSRVAGAPASPLDPMRMLPDDAYKRFALERERELSGADDGARWLAGLVNQLAYESTVDRCELTPLYARTGQQNLFQLYRDYRDKVAASPHLVRSALESWERIGGDSGANLDGRALRDAAAMGDGKSDNAAVPGATWLALMSVPFFPHVGDRGRPLAVGWRNVGRKGRPRKLVWPVWRPLLDRPSIDVLLGHPLVETVSSPSGGDPSLSARLQALGVVAVCSASRRKLGNSDGPLQGASVLWSA